MNTQHAALAASKRRFHIESLEERIAPGFAAMGHGSFSRQFQFQSQFQSQSQSQFQFQSISFSFSFSSMNAA